MAGIDESGKPTSISHSADNLRVERAQYDQWRVTEQEQWRVAEIEFEKKSAARQQGLAGWSYDSEKSGLINEGLIGRILSDEMRNMQQGLFKNEQNQQGNSSAKQQKVSSASAMTEWLEGASEVSQYLSNGILGLQGLANQGFGVGLIAQTDIGGTSSMMRQLGLGQYSPFALSFDGSSLTHANNSTHYFGFGNTANMTRGYGVADLLNTRVMGVLDVGLTWAGPVTSGMQMLDYAYFQNSGAGHSWEDHGNGRASHLAKFTADSGFAAASVLGGPVGVGAAAAYTVTDLALSITPEYKIRYGQSSGEMVQGWEKAGFYTLDKVSGATNKTIDFRISPKGLDVLIKPFPVQTPIRKN